MRIALASGFLFLFGPLLWSTEPTSFSVEAFEQTLTKSCFVTGCREYSNGSRQRLDAAESMKAFRIYGVRIAGPQERLPFIVAPAQSPAALRRAQLLVSRILDRASSGQYRAGQGRYTFLLETAGRCARLTAVERLPDHTVLTGTMEFTRNALKTDGQSRLFAPSSARLISVGQTASRINWQIPVQSFMGWLRMLKMSSPELTLLAGERLPGLRELRVQALYTFERWPSFVLFQESRILRLPGLLPWLAHLARRAAF